METDWYKNNIEEGIRDLVKFLRNNGINTMSSCEHENPMCIHCQSMEDGQIKTIHDLLWTYFYERNEPVTFSIELHHDVVDSCTMSSISISISIPKTK